MRLRFARLCLLLLACLFGCGGGCDGCDADAGNKGDAGTADDGGGEDAGPTTDASMQPPDKRDAGKDADTGSDEKPPPIEDAGRPDARPVSMGGVPRIEIVSPGEEVDAYVGQKLVLEAKCTDPDDQPLALQRWSLTGDKGATHDGARWSGVSFAKPGEYDAWFYCRDADDLDVGLGVHVRVRAAPIPIIVADVDLPNQPELWAADLSKPDDLRRLNAPIEETDTAVSQIEYTPDGRAIVALATLTGYARHQAFITDRATHTSHELVVVDGEIQYFVISPDSRYVALQTNDGMYLVRIDGEAPGAARLVSDTGPSQWQSRALFSPDGGLLLVWGSTLSLVDVDAVDPPIVLDARGPIAQNTIPWFSPDGQHIAYLRIEGEARSAYVFARATPDVRHQIDDPNFPGDVVHVGASRVHLAYDENAPWHSTDLDGNAQSVPTPTLWPLQGCGERLLLSDLTTLYVSEDLNGVTSAPVAVAPIPQTTIEMQDCTQISWLTVDAPGVTQVSLGPLTGLALGSPRTATWSDVESVDAYRISAHGTYAAMHSAEGNLLRVVHLATGAVVFESDPVSGAFVFSADESRLVFAHLITAGGGAGHSCELEEIALAADASASASPVADMLGTCVAPLALSPDSTSIAYEAQPARDRTHPAGVFELDFGDAAGTALLPASQALTSNLFEARPIGRTRALAYSNTDRYHDTALWVVDAQAQSAAVLQADAASAGPLVGFATSSSSAALSYWSSDSVWIDTARTSSYINPAGPFAARIMNASGDAGPDDFVYDLGEPDFNFVHITRTGSITEVAPTSSQLITVTRGRPLYTGLRDDDANTQLYLGPKAPSVEPPVRLNVGDDGVNGVLGVADERVWYVDLAGGVHTARVSDDPAPQLLGTLIYSLAHAFASDQRGLLYADASHELRLSRVDAPEPIAIAGDIDTNVVCLALGPNAQRAVYGRRQTQTDPPFQSRFELFTVETETAHTQALPIETPWMVDPTCTARFAPDGRHALVTITVQANPQRYLVAFDGDNEPSVTELPPMADTPVFDALGQYLLYTAVSQGAQQLSALAVDAPSTPIALGPQLDAARYVYQMLWLDQ